MLEIKFQKYEVHFSAKYGNFLAANASFLILC